MSRRTHYTKEVRDSHSRGLRARIDADIAACKRGCISVRTAAEKFNVPVHVIRIWFQKGYLAGHIPPPTIEWKQRHAAREARLRERWGDKIPDIFLSRKPHRVIHIIADAGPAKGIQCPHCEGSGWVYPCRLPRDDGKDEYANRSALD